MLRQGMCRKAWVSFEPCIWQWASREDQHSPWGIVIFRSHYKLSLNMLQLLKLETVLSLCRLTKIIHSCQIPASHCNITVNVYIIKSITKQKKREKSNLVRTWMCSVSSVKSPTFPPVALSCIALPGTLSPSTVAGWGFLSMSRMYWIF